MNAIRITGLIPILQTAIGPTILISGVGLLLLSFTNRLARTIDRTREMVDERSTSSGGEQLRILWRRARVLRIAILLAGVSLLCAALLIIALFLTALFRLELAWAVAALFIGGMIALIGSILYFLQDVNEALSALRLEIGDRTDKSGR